MNTTLSRVAIAALLFAVSMLAQGPLSVRVRDLGGSAAPTGACESGARYTQTGNPPLLWICGASLAWVRSSEPYANDRSPRASKLRNWIPPQFNQRRVMASPPATTFTTSATIASPNSWRTVTYNGVNNVAANYFTYNRSGSPVMQGTAFPDYLFVGFRPITSTGGGRVPSVAGVSFMHYGTAIELFMKGVTGSFLVKVNDEYITLTAQAVPNDGAGYYYYINFASAALRRIEFIGYNSLFGGVMTAATDSVYPAPVRGPRTIIVGDSFTEGSGVSTSNVNGFVQLFADAMGWDDVWGSGVGATGYLAAPGGKLTFRQRVAADVYAYSPDVVIIAGGRNDTASTAAAVGAEAELLFADIRSNLPSALLIVTSPFWQAGPQTHDAGLIAMRDAIRTAATNNGGLFVDLLEMPVNPELTLGTATLHNSPSAGASTFQTTAASTIMANSTIQFPNGERYYVKATSGGSTPITVTIDGPLATNHSAGEVITQIGNSFWVGTGRVGNTTGFGNGDVYVSSDGTHPTDAGHAAIGYEVARQVANLLR
jgi:lysophospholipase L1-like esterase